MEKKDEYFNQKNIKKITRENIKGEENSDGKLIAIVSESKRFDISLMHIILVMVRSKK
jgi:hypothetical protein